MIVYEHKDYNTQVFNLKDKDGLTKGMNFIQNLLKDDVTNDESYNDVHTFIEENNLIVSWTQVYYDFAGECGKFKFVNADEIVLKEVIFPDNHIEYASCPEEEEEMMNQFLADNPGWVRTSYGTWTNEIENQEFQKMLEEERKKEEKNGN